jgi:hypothetical protein
MIIEAMENLLILFNKITDNYCQTYSTIGLKIHLVSFIHVLPPNYSTDSQL